MDFFLKKLFGGATLTRAEACKMMDMLMLGEGSPEQVGAFLGVIRGRGETIDEIVGFATSLAKHAITLPVKRKDLIDTCGTGGDSAQTFNISTVNSFVCAAAGLGVVKHGNRSVSSKSGSADVLEALGVPIDLSPLDCAQAIDDIGFAFLFAPNFHPAMKNVVPIRRSLGVRTVFNLLGPLCNPGKVSMQVMGVYDAGWIEKLAYVLRDLGVREAMVVHGEDGMDEITLCAGTRVAHLKEGDVKTYLIRPEDIGFSRCSLKELVGGGPEENAKIAKDILSGRLRGPKRDIVVINAAAALVVGGCVKTLEEGRRAAESLIDGGEARKILENVRSSVVSS